MLGDLQVPAAVGLGETDDALHPRLGLACVANEKVVDDRTGSRIHSEELDPHRPSRVVAAAHDAGLLEHPDEDARIVIASWELSGSTVPPAP